VLEVEAADVSVTVSFMVSMVGLVNRDRLDLKNPHCKK